MDEFDRAHAYARTKAERDHWKSLALMAHAGPRKNISKGRRKRGSKVNTDHLYELYHDEDLPKRERPKRPPTEKQNKCHENFRDTVRVAKRFQLEKEGGLPWKEAMKKAFAQKRGAGM